MTWHMTWHVRRPSDICLFSRVIPSCASDVVLQCCQAAQLPPLYPCFNTLDLYYNIMLLHYSTLGPGQVLARAPPPPLTLLRSPPPPALPIHIQSHPLKPLLRPHPAPHPTDCPALFSLPPPTLNYPHLATLSIPIPFPTLPLLWPCPPTPSSMTEQLCETHCSSPFLHPNNNLIYSGRTSSTVLGTVKVRHSVAYISQAWVSSQLVTLLSLLSWGGRAVGSYKILITSFCHWPLLSGKKEKRKENKLRNLQRVKKVPLAQVITHCWVWDQAQRLNSKHDTKSVNCWVWVWASKNLCWSGLFFCFLFFLVNSINMTSCRGQALDKQQEYCALIKDNQSK